MAQEPVWAAMAQGTTMCLTALAMDDNRECRMLRYHSWRPNHQLRPVHSLGDVLHRPPKGQGMMSQLKNKWDKLKGDYGAWRKLMRKQTGTGWNWDKGTINMDAEWWKKIKQEIPGVGKFKNRPIQNEDDLKVMFGSIINEEIDHWNPMSSNPIIPPSGDAPHHIDLDNGEEDEMGHDNDFDNVDEEVSPTPAKRKAHIILEKPNKKPKSSTALVIQDHISKISDSAQAFVASKQVGITIGEVMTHVIACGAAEGSDEHYVATELFVKKEHREMFMTFSTDEARFNWLKRKFDMLFSK
ncbi:uncharacterized protein LOC8080028 [Sorghum bicolor]|uniref:uncharacterized protein LOC8080028 n=1 Tax=Sorghum bicolor TaxID=4558 RepID=UPI000B425025|nr:uncharacterized protein LOC8080028 [Sorghum bicolor]|eukprot:XP_021305436.1 uncharacterized protein LOC8080028 [Sorghum bicolor]